MPDAALPEGCGCEGPKCRLDATSVRHGTPTGYANWFCRCAECKAAGRQYRIDTDAAGYGRRWSRKRGVVSRAEHLARVHKNRKGHGTTACYARGCRRDECVAAEREHNRARAAERKAKRRADKQARREAAWEIIGEYRAMVEQASP